MRNVVKIVEMLPVSFQPYSHELKICIDLNGVIVSTEPKEKPSLHPIAISF